MRRIEPARHGQAHGPQPVVLTVDPLEPEAHDGQGGFSSLSLRQRLLHRSVGFLGNRPMTVLDPRLEVCGQQLERCRGMGRLAPHVFLKRGQELLLQVGQLRVFLVVALL